MSSGGLLQLVATGSQDISFFHGGPGNSSLDFIEFPFETAPTFGESVSSDIPRNGDTLEELKLKIRVGAAPQGYRWKRCWPLLFLKKAAITVGGQPFWETSSEQLQMEHLIFPKEVSPELLFDFSPEIRTEKSKEEQEVWLEPIPLQKLIIDEYRIPLIRLAYHIVRFQIETASLADCLEAIADMPPPLPTGTPIHQLLRSCKCVGTYRYLDTHERRKLTQTHFIKTLVKTPLSVTEQIQRQGDTLSLKVSGDGTCSAAYLWITDRDGKELPNSVVDNIQVRLNGHVRHDFSGFQARHGMSQHLPHKIQENTQSTNLYYIPFWSGRTNPTNGFEQGLNYSHVDSMDWKLRLKQETPVYLRMTLLHRIQNEFNTGSGMGALIWDYSSPRFELAEGGSLRRNWGSPLLNLPDQPIEITADTECIIWQAPFEENVGIAKCHTCHKYANAEALRMWFRSTSCNPKGSCPHCRSVTGFTYGRAKLPDVTPVASPSDSPAPSIEAPA